MMLRELHIRNFAIVDHLRLTFSDGLNVITGETGAGKSLIVNAIDLILGGRARTEQIRSGSDEARIEAFFEIRDNAVCDEMGINCDEGLIVKRVITKGGKSRAYLNESMVTVQALSSLGDGLVDLHGQHEHQSLLSPSVQRNIIDKFGRLDPLVKKLGELYSRYQSLSRTIRDSREREREREQRIELLRYQVSEIESAGLREGEKEELLKEKAILSNIANLKYLSETAFAILRDEEGSVLEKLAMVTKSVEEINRFDRSSDELLRILKDAEAILQDAGDTLREIKERYDCDPARLDEVESRLALIEGLERKYGGGIAEILSYREKAVKELEGLETEDERLSMMETEMKEVHQLLMQKADELSEKRKKTAGKIERAIKRLLTELAFGHPDFRIDIAEIPVTSTGKDRVEFLFSANPGQQPRPLSRIASGGELSRVMLALKNIFAEVDRVPVLIFDEVDAGVGGMTADYVGQRLKMLSGQHQVICITHLPQIASRADNHICIKKEFGGEGVAVSVKVLNDEERIREIARMLSGSVTDSSLRHAEELVKGGMQ
jgi:DNA repair protein RecN (Recombination protein N)